MFWSQATLRTLAAVLGGISFLAHSASSQTATEFYAGKTIDLTVGYAPGGNYDLNARLIAPYLSKYISGHPAVIVRNVAGAGGLALLNSFANLGGFFGPGLMGWLKQETGNYSGGLLALAGALSILLGYRAKIGAWLLVLFLVPVTLAMHNFWAVHDPMMMQIQMGMFMKNVSILGGALLIAHFGAGPLSLDARRHSPVRR